SVDGGQGDAEQQPAAQTCSRQVSPLPVERRARHTRHQGDGVGQRGHDPRVPVAGAPVNTAVPTASSTPFTTTLGQAGAPPPAGPRASGGGGPGAAATPPWASQAASHGPTAPVASIRRKKNSPPPGGGRQRVANTAETPRLRAAPAPGRRREDHVG